ncbi:hypothetical protein BDN71DRAFT_1514553 [Pleurotus eryngii]|uniref:Uncharacterized protein n=1 Tax=Pleurotus eryngii TaxID=5323 RepID=A0A9P5ZG75_PLEER|nr:hypothetical protein BDN71DRAFT_1514553 [Pleurotus eryngii]
MKCLSGCIEIETGESIEPNPCRIIRLFSPLSYHLQRHPPSPPPNVIYEPAVSPSIPRNSTDPSLLPLSAVSPNLSPRARISSDSPDPGKRNIHPEKHKLAREDEINEGVFDDG